MCDCIRHAAMHHSRLCCCIIHHSLSDKNVSVSIRTALLLRCDGVEPGQWHAAWWVTIGKMSEDRLQSTEVWRVSTVYQCWHTYMWRCAATLSPKNTFIEKHNTYRANWGVSFIPSVWTFISVYLVFSLRELMFKLLHAFQRLCFAFFSTPKKTLPRSITLYGIMQIFIIFPASGALSN